MTKKRGTRKWEGEKGCRAWDGWCVAGGRVGEKMEGGIDRKNGKEKGKGKKRGEERVWEVSAVCGWVGKMVGGGRRGKRKRKENENEKG